MKVTQVDNTAEKFQAIRYLLISSVYYYRLIPGYYYFNNYFTLLSATILRYIKEIALFFIAMFITRSKQGQLALQIGCSATSTLSPGSQSHNY